MAELAVSCMRSAKYHCKLMNANKVISILDPNMPNINFNVETLHLKFHDISSAAGLSMLLNPPNKNHIKSIIYFARTLSDNDRVLIHCHAGISRSPAAALIIYTVLTKDPEEAYKQLEKTMNGSPFEPNKSMIKIADHLLGLNRILYDLTSRKISASLSYGPIDW